MVMQSPNALLRTTASACGRSCLRMIAQAHGLFWDDVSGVRAASQRGATPAQVVSAAGSVSRILTLAICALVATAVGWPKRTQASPSIALEAEPKAAHFHWVAERGEARVVLVGEVHSLQLPSSALSDALKTEVERAQALGVEYASSPQHPIFWDKSGRKLSSRLGEEKYRRLLASLTEQELALLGRSVGGLDRFDAMNPGFAGVLLMSVGGHEVFQKNRAAQRHVAAGRASMAQQVVRLRGNRELLFLDSDQSIADMWESCNSPDALWVYLTGSLQDGRERAPAIVQNSDELRTAMQSGRLTEALASLARAMEVRSQAEFQRCGVDARNEAWLARIESHLVAYRHIVYVAGIAHFSGERSILKLLERAGLSVRRVESTN